MTDQLWIDGEGPYEVENFKNGERIDDAELDLDIICCSRGEETPCLRRPDRRGQSRS